MICPYCGATATNQEPSWCPTCGKYSDQRTTASDESATNKKDRPQQSGGLSILATLYKNSTYWYKAGEGGKTMINSLAYVSWLRSRQTLPHNIPLADKTQRRTLWSAKQLTQKPLLSDAAFSIDFAVYLLYTSGNVEALNLHGGNTYD